MSLIAANTDSLTEASGHLNGSGVGRALSRSTTPSFGDPATDAAVAGFTSAWSAHMNAVDQLVNAAGTALGIYAANFQQVGG